jgi:putative ABC transport system permease protein
MDPTEYLGYSVRNLARRSLRSWLTIIGMVIGVIAIVIILSISEGFNADIQKQVSAFGADMMFVYPVGNIGQTLSGGSSSLMTTSGKLRQKDVDDIKGIPGVKAVSRSLFGRASMTFKGKNITSFLIGTDRNMFDMYTDYITVEKGRFFKEGERNAIFFGADAATDYFGKDKVEVGSVVQLNGKNFRVVGIAKRIGTALSKSDDSQIYVSFDDAKDLFRGQFLPDEVGMIMIQADQGFNPEDIKTTIEHKLASNHHVRLDDLDFSVITSKQIMDIIGTVLLSVQIVLAAVALIASLVGAIGIANTMFMGVLDRMQEIGILKAVGATQREILILFLTDAALIGLAGGFIGLVLGYISLEALVALFNVPALLRLRIIAFVFIFSIGTGILAGFIPAWRAAKMDPVDALRYE